MGISLSQLAQSVGVELHGDPDCVIDRVDTIQDGSEGSICFLANRKYLKHLSGMQASAVILDQQFLPQCKTNALISNNPYLTYARVASLLYPQLEIVGGVHPTAVVADDAEIDSTASIGACCVIEKGARIGSEVHIEPGCVVGRDVVIGEKCQIKANVTLCSDTEIGARVVIHPGAVIGSDGFGNANDQGQWEKVPQVGKVVIEDDVEIGSNTTVDRGAIRDTIIRQGARLDNQIQIAHNVQIGEHTAIAGCAGIAGSTVVGRYCTLGGGVGVSGHLDIGDNVHFSAQSFVTRSFKEPGYYSGNVPAVPNGDWRKTIARLRHLDEMAKRVKALENRLASMENTADKPTLQEMPSKRDAD